MPAISEFPETAKNCILGRLHFPSQSQQAGTINAATRDGGDEDNADADAGFFTAYYRKAEDFHSHGVNGSETRELFWIIPFVFDSIAFAALALDDMTRRGHGSFGTLRNFLSNMSFYGLTGKIEFQNENRVGGELALYHVDIYTGQIYQLSSAEILAHFSDIKTSRILPDDVSLFSATGILFIVIFGIIIIVSLFSCVYLFYWRDTPIIKASSYVWHFFVLLSFILYSIGCIIWEFPKSSYTCTLKVNFIVLAAIVLCVCLAYKCLIFFTIKHGIANSSTNFLILVILVFFFSINVLLFHIGISVDGGGNLSAVIMQSTYDPFYFFHACAYIAPPLSGDAQYKTTPGNLPWYNSSINLIIFIINFIFIIGLSAISFEVKNLSVPYEECKYLSLSIFFLSFCFLLFSSLYWSFVELYYYYQKRFLVRSIISVVVIAGLYSLLIIPKLIYIRQFSTTNAMERRSIFGNILASFSQLFTYVRDGFMNNLPLEKKHAAGLIRVSLFDQCVIL